MSPKEPFLVICRCEHTGHERVVLRYRTELAAHQGARRFNTNAERFGTRLHYYVLPDGHFSSDQDVRVAPSVTPDGVVQGEAQLTAPEP
jgi:hypothetical protein